MVRIKKIIIWIIPSVCIGIMNPLYNYTNIASWVAWPSIVDALLVAHVIWPFVIYALMKKERRKKYLRIFLISSIGFANIVFITPYLILYFIYDDVYAIEELMICFIPMLISLVSILFVSFAFVKKETVN